MSGPNSLSESAEEHVEWLPDGSRLAEWEGSVVTDLFNACAPGEDFNPDAMPMWGGAHSRLVDLLRPDIPVNVSYRDISLYPMGSPENELRKALEANGHTLPDDRTFPKPTAAIIAAATVKGYEIGAEAVSTGRGPIDVVIAAVWYLCIPGNGKHYPDVYRYFQILERNDDAYTQLLEDSQLRRYDAKLYQLSLRVYHGGGFSAPGKSTKQRRYQSQRDRRLR